MLGGCFFGNHQLFKWITQFLQNIDTICAELVECANSRGGEDNITVVLVRYGKKADT